MKKELLQYAPIARFLKDALGERYRVTLVDADDPSCEMVVCEKGFAENKIENIQEAGILSDVINSAELKKRDYLCSFQGSEEGAAEEKNSIFYIRNEKKEISGFLCIYEERDDLYMVREVLNQLLLPEEQAASGSERIENEVNSLLKERIIEAWKKYNPQNKKIKKSEKIAFISELFEMGIFRMKGAAVRVSEVTGISQASIYRYLGEVLED